METSLTNEQLVARIQAGGGDVAEDMLQLWNQNQGIIKIHVSRYSKVAEAEDLEQEAYIALCDAVKNYQPGESLFVNYLGYWLTKAMGRYYKKNYGPFRVPEWKYPLLTRVRKTTREFEQQFFRAPTPVELQRLLRVSRAEIDEAIFLDIARSSVSIYKEIGEDDESITLESIIAAETDPAEDAIESSLQEEMKEAIRRELQKLPGSWATAITLVHLDGKSVKEAAQRMSTTPGNVQRMITSGFIRLRRKARRQLKPYICDEALCVAYRGTLSYFRTTGSSSTENAAIKNAGYVPRERW